MGIVPPASEATSPSIHADVSQVFQLLSSQGLSQEDLERITKKYSFPPEFTAPALNSELAAVLGDSSLTRDRHFLVKQNLEGPAAGLLGAFLSASGVAVPAANALEMLADDFRLTGHLFFLLSSSRKAFIEPNISKDIRHVLKDSKSSDLLLFGSDLVEKIKSARAIGKLGAALKPTPAKRQSSAARGDFRQSGRGRGSKSGPKTSAPPNRKTTTPTDLYSRRKKGGRTSGDYSLVHMKTVTFHVFCRLYWFFSICIFLLGTSFTLVLVYRFFWLPKFLSLTLKSAI